MLFERRQRKKSKHSMQPAREEAEVSVLEAGQFHKQKPNPEHSRNKQVKAGIASTEDKPQAHQIKKATLETQSEHDSKGYTLKQNEGRVC